MILREKVKISRIVWLIVAVVVAGYLANVVIIQKGGDVVRVYDLWLKVLRPSSYAGADFVEVVRGLGFIACCTFVVFGISAGIGWLVAAIAGSVALLFRKR